MTCFEVKYLRQGIHRDRVEFNYLVWSPVWLLFYYYEFAVGLCTGHVLRSVRTCIAKANILLQSMKPHYKPQYIYRSTLDITTLTCMLTLMLRKKKSPTKHASLFLKYVLYTSNTSHLHYVNYKNDKSSNAASFQYVCCTVISLLSYV